MGTVLLDRGWWLGTTAGTSVRGRDASPRGEDMVLNAAFQVTKALHPEG